MKIGTRIGFWVAMAASALLLAIVCCAHGVVNADDVTLIRVQSDCSNVDYWLSAQSRVRLVYIDGRTGSRISYIFECSNGLLVNPVEEKREVHP